MERVERAAMAIYSNLRRDGVRLTHWSPVWAEASSKQQQRFISLIAPWAAPSPNDTRLRAAARAVVERWEELTYELPGRIDDPINDRMDALREALEQAGAA